MTIRRAHLTPDVAAKHGFAEHVKLETCRGAVYATYRVAGSRKTVVVNDEPSEPDQQEFTTRYAIEKPDAYAECQVELAASMLADGRSA